MLYKSYSTVLLIDECSDEEIVMEAVRRHTWRRNEPVKLFVDQTSDGSAFEKPETVMSLLKSVSEKMPDHPALGKLIRFFYFFIYLQLRI